ncbi:MAG: hypothetical protein QM501_13850 [Gimesia sp.]
MCNSALFLLSKYCKSNEYRGWDLFDGLNSKMFLTTPLYRSRLLRLIWIQFFKRSFINLRPLTLVPKGHNAKGLGLFASGMFAQGKINEAEQMLEKLKVMTCSDYPGSSWGYNFDWEARAFYVPQGKPNIVTTVFVANAFLDDYKLTNNDESIRLADGACEFILKSLILHEDENSLCFGYIPDEEARVHNANMLGAALLGRVYALTGNAEYLEKSRKAMAYSVAALKSDYSWPYGERSHHQFIDNFHTGFNLVALKTWMDSTGEQQWQEQLEGAYRYFLDTFWLENGCPKYYHNSLYPIDIHCSAQGIVTCLKLKNLDSRSLPLAEKIAQWAVDNMQDKKRGYFYYQKTRFYTNKIPYIRWSQAWMFYALALLLKEQSADLSQGE